MAAGKFFFYDIWGQKEASGDISFMISGGINAAVLKSSYTPGTHSHSLFSQISSHQATASGSIVNALALSGRHISISGIGNVKYVASNISGFSAGGATFKAKYLALYGASSSILMGFLDLDTGATTGVEVSQLDINWNSQGIAKNKLNQ